MLRRIPSRRQWQGDGERCAGDAEDDADEENPGKAVDAVEPGDEQADDHDHLADQAGALRLEMIDQHTVDDPDQGAGEHRHRDHQPLLRVVEIEVTSDLDAQRSEHHPDHEGDVEIEERGE